jgi:hypothetical protein
VGASCGPIVETAPFSVRPDSLEPADLLGPYDGLVFDAETDRAVSGATVAASWAFERGIGLTGPAAVREVVVETGADGRYRIPRLRDLPGGGTMRLQRFTLIVYQRGYVGWRSDHRFPTGDRRRDFAQRGARVRLEKWQDDLSHFQHLAFLGGGAAVRKAAAWEVQPASLELEGVAPGRRAPPEEAPVAGPAPLDATPLLSEEEVRGVTGFAGPFEIGRLGDLPRTEFYDSRHFRAQGRTEQYDVALRVWRLGQAGAEAQYNRLAAELPGAEPRDEIADASLRARTPDVLGLAFLDRDRGIVVSVTCGTAQCTDPAMLLRLARLIEARLPDLPSPEGARATPAAPEGAQEPQGQE